MAFLADTVFVEPRNESERACYARLEGRDGDDWHAKLRMIFELEGMSWQKRAAPRTFFFSIQQSASALSNRRSFRERLWRRARVKARV